MDLSSPFKLSPQAVYDSAVTATVLYVFIITTVRLLGVRSISNLNNFDWIVLVAVGAITGTAIVSREVTAAEGLVALASLFCLQWLVTFSSSHSRFAARIFRARATELGRNGRMDKQRLRAVRMTDEEVMAQVRRMGIAELRSVELIMLEPDGQISVIERDSPVVSDLP